MTGTELFDGTQKSFASMAILCNDVNSPDEEGLSD